MVTNITSLTGNGLKDWLIQRVSAVYLTLYTIFLVSFFCLHKPLDYAQWHRLFTQAGFRIATVTAILLLTLHAWIGLWTVTTDYMRCTVMRLSLQMLIGLWLLCQFLWTVMIIWGQ